MADSKFSALPAASALDGTEVLPIVQGGVGKKVTSAQLGAQITRTCTTTFNNSTTTPASVTELEASLAPGTYLIKIWMVLQSAATTTGPGIHLNCSGGTVSRVLATWYSLTTGTTATSGVMDQASVAATFQTMEGRAQRANNVQGAAFGGVDTAAADQFAVLEGIVVVTATTTLQTMLVSEVAASQVSMMAGSTMTAQKVA